MPTLECLDERSQAILRRIDEVDAKSSAYFREFKEMIERRNSDIERRLESVEEDIVQIRLDKASEDGKKRGFVWAGGIALTAFSAIFGAVGNMIYQWATSPHGPFALK